MANGGPGLQDSLTFHGGTLPEAVRDAFAGGKYVELEIDVPYAVNVRVSGGTWHGEKLDDLSGLVPSSSDDIVIVPVLFLKKKPVEVALRSFYAAQHNLPAKLKVHVHHFTLAFALTDFKLQGRTLNRLIISILRRPKCSPPLNMNAFYVLVSRLRAQSGLRILQHDTVALKALATLQHDAYLGAWDRGCDAQGSWHDARAKGALCTALSAKAHTTALQKATRAAAASLQKQARSAAAANERAAKRAKPPASRAKRSRPSPHSKQPGIAAMPQAAGCGAPLRAALLVNGMAGGGSSSTDPRVAMQAVTLAMAQHDTSAGCNAPLTATAWRKSPAAATAYGSAHIWSPHHQADQIESD